MSTITNTPSTYHPPANGSAHLNDNARPNPNSKLTQLPQEVLMHIGEQLLGEHNTVDVARFAKTCKTCHNAMNATFGGQSLLDRAQAYEAKRSVAKEVAAQSAELSQRKTEIFEEITQWPTLQNLGNLENPAIRAILENLVPAIARHEMQRDQHLNNNPFNLNVRQLNDVARHTHQAQQLRTTLEQAFGGTFRATPAAEFALATLTLATGMQGAIAQRL